MRALANELKDDESGSVRVHSGAAQHANKHWFPDDDNDNEMRKRATRRGNGMRMREREENRESVGRKSPE